MDWRSSFKRASSIRGAKSAPVGIGRGTRRAPGFRRFASWRLAGNLLLATALVTSAAACGREAVRASEKEFLADRVMRFDSDPHQASADEHLNSNREGSAGGRGTGGGGCGCN